MQSIQALSALIVSETSCQRKTKPKAVYNSKKLCWFSALLWAMLLCSGCISNMGDFVIMDAVSSQNLSWCWSCIPCKETPLSTKCITQGHGNQGNVKRIIYKKKKKRFYIFLVTLSSKMFTLWVQSLSNDFLKSKVHDLWWHCVTVNVLLCSKVLVQGVIGACVVPRLLWELWFSDCVQVCKCRVEHWSRMWGN